MADEVKEDPLKQPTTTTLPGAADDLVARGGAAATGIDSPTIMRREQSDPKKLPRHITTGKEPSKN